MEFIRILFLLLFVHAVSDFALQSDSMAKGKNRHSKPDFIPKGQKYVPCWPYWLSAHAMIHAGMVYLVTGSLLLGAFEFIFHWVVDFAKCENMTNPNQDQFLHFAIKIIYAVYYIV